MASFELVSSDVRSTFFGTGLDGAGNALGKNIDLIFARAIAAGEQVLTAAISDIERAARIADMRSLTEWKVYNSIAAEYEARALAAGQGSRLAEIFRRTSSEFSNPIVS